MSTILIILAALDWMFLIFFGIAAVYFLLFALASHFYKEQNTANPRHSSMLILIPAYKEDSVILETALSAVKHASVLVSKDIWIIADSLQASTIERIRATGANVLVVEFEKSTKAKSVNKALHDIDGKWDYITILDADNIMADGFIDAVALRLQSGFRVVQGHRTAKNSNTAFALLDGISEEVNNSIFRKGHRVLGLSASLIGSGFACEYDLFKIIMLSNEAVGGFDKKLEIDFLLEKITIGYGEDAVIYDEKVQQSATFVNQRRRWISAQLIYFSRYAVSAVKELFLRGNIDYFDKIYQFIVPPRVVAVGVTVMFVALHIIVALAIKLNILLLLILWIAIALATAAAILIAIPAKYYNRGMLRSVLLLPKGFLLMLLAFARIRGANKKFIHTQHGIK